jgi:hypothetical protein
MPGMAPPFKPPPRTVLQFLFIGAFVFAALFCLLVAGVVLRAFELFFYVALFLAGLVAAAALLTAIGRYVLGPLDRAARHWMRPTQFTMIDFLSLIFLFQLPMAALRPLGGERGDAQELIWLLYFFCWVVTAAMWGLSVRTLSRAGIENTWHRGVFLAFVLPAAYFGSIALVVALCIAVVAMCMEGIPSATAALTMLAVVAGLLTAFFLSAKFVRKMVAASPLAENFASEEPRPAAPHESRTVCGSSFKSDTRSS